MSTRAGEATREALQRVLQALDTVPESRRGLDASARLELAELARTAARRMSALAVVLVAEADTPTTRGLASQLLTDPGATRAEAVGAVFAGRDLLQSEPVRQAALAGTLPIDRARTVAKAIRALPDALTGSERAEAEADLVTHAAEITARTIDQAVASTLSRVAPRLVPTGEDELARLDAQRRRARARRHLRLLPDNDGGLDIIGHLPQLEAAPLVTMINALADADRRNLRRCPDRLDPRHARTPEQVRADALVTLVTHATTNWTNHQGVGPTAAGRGSGNERSGEQRPDAVLSDTGRPDSDLPSNGSLGAGAAGSRGQGSGSASGGFAGGLGADDGLDDDRAHAPAPSQTPLTDLGSSGQGPAHDPTTATTDEVDQSAGGAPPATDGASDDNRPRPPAGSSPPGGSSQRVSADPASNGPTAGGQELVDRSSARGGHEADSPPAGVGQPVSPPAGGWRVPDRARVMVIMDEASLRDRAEKAGILTIGGPEPTPISAGELRRLCCDAALIPAVLGADSIPLDLGRETRLVTPEVRHALVLRDKGCVFPGCTTGPDLCEAHHIIPWYLGGTTTPDNLALLCPHHHGLIEPPRLLDTQLRPDRWSLAMINGRPHVTPPQRPSRAA